MKQSLYTAAMVVGILILVNQFDATRNLVYGGNRFFN